MNVCMQVVLSDTIYLSTYPHADVHVYGERQWQLREGDEDDEVRVRLYVCPDHEVDDEEDDDEGNNNGNNNGNNHHTNNNNEIGYWLGLHCLHLPSSPFYAHMQLYVRHHSEMRRRAEQCTRIAERTAIVLCDHEDDEDDDDNDDDEDNDDEDERVYASVQHGTIGWRMRLSELVNSGAVSRSDGNNSSGNDNDKNDGPRFCSLTFAVVLEIESQGETWLDGVEL